MSGPEVSGPEVSTPGVSDAAARAVAFLRQASEGIRVVVRYRLDDGRATDALGELLLVDATRCVVETQRGRQTIALAEVIAAKLVPPRAKRVAGRGGA